MKKKYVTPSTGKVHLFPAPNLCVTSIYRGNEKASWGAGNFDNEGYDNPMSIEINDDIDSQAPRSVSWDDW